MSENQPLTRIQLEEKFEWQDNFPQVIQDRLFEHYTQFGCSVSDIQSASDSLFWATQKKPMSAFLAEHRQYFGSASADDLASMIKALAQLQSTTLEVNNEKHDLEK